MLKISNIKIPLSFFQKKGDISEKNLVLRFLSKELKEKEVDIRKFSIVKKSIDARKKPDIFLIYSIEATFPNEDILLKKKHSKLTVERKTKKVYEINKPLFFDDKNRPLIIGDGPAGLFAAYVLATAGLCPIVFERGSMIEKRENYVNNFFNDGHLSERTNVCFGEGGAGTFSDGKLNTLTKDHDGRQGFVLETFHHYGADENILYDAKPHIGTDRLLNILPAMRSAITSLGGEFLFESRVDEICFEETNGKKRFTGLVTDTKGEFKSSCCILATGHSARDTMRMLFSHDIKMSEKEFAVGLRIEHPQEMIDKSQYGIIDSFLPAAAYKLTSKAPSGRGVWTFCMCPGGMVINSSSERGLLSINGMSNAARDGNNANSAVIVSVGKEDFKESGPLSSIAFQEELEKKAFLLSNGAVPQQLFIDFVEKKESHSYGRFKSETLGKTAFGRLDTLFSDSIYEALVCGIKDFGQKINGFDREDAILSGVESRTSSPVRIERGDDLESLSVEGLYPCGEGAGYAGGIMSAAVDGIKCAERLMEKYYS